jgi:large subunit ribosomal protein L21
MAEAKKKTTKKSTAKKSAPKKTATKKSTAKKSAPKKAAVKKENNDKFAVIELAGTQLKVREGKMYEVKKLSGNKGDKLEIENVLMIVNGDDRKIGEPYVKDAKVTLEIDSQKKGEKVKVFKYKAKSRYRRKYGHRPSITRVLVKKIS